MELTIDQALQKGIEMHKAGQIQEADRLYSSILKAQRGHPDANHNMGVLAVDLGKIKESLPFFKTALEAKPGVAQFWLSYIESLINLDQIADAKAVFDQAKDKGAKGEGFDLLEKRLSDQVSVVNNTQAIEVEGSKYSKPNILDTIKLDKALRLANRKFKEGQLEEAKDIYQHILQKFPKNKQALTAIQSLTEGAVPAPYAPSSNQLKPIISLYTKGQFQQALSHSIEMLEQFPNSALLHNIAGACNAGLKQYDAAIDRYRKAININPDYAEAYKNMGIVLRDKGELEAAIVSFQQALQIKPDYAEAHCNMGIALRDKGNPDAAINSYNQALRIKPDYYEAYYNMGNVLRSDKGNSEAAIDSYKLALKINPGCVRTLIGLGKTFKLLGQTVESIKCFEDAIILDPEDTLGANLQLASLGQKGIPLKTPTNYMNAFYKEKSKLFHSSVPDNYHGHLLIKNAIRATCNYQEKAKILDLGCGNGILSSFLSSYAETLDGIDLSPDMIRGAHKTGLYDSLYEKEIELYLANISSHYDVIIAAAVMIHFFDLEDIFLLIRNSLKPGGKFIFSVFEGSNADLQLNDFLMYSHSDRYITNLADRIDFKVNYRNQAIHEYHREKPVTALIYMLQKAE